MDLSATSPRFYPARPGRLERTPLARALAWDRARHAIDAAIASAARFHASAVAVDARESAISAGIAECAHVQYSRGARRRRQTSKNYVKSYIDAERAASAPSVRPRTDAEIIARDRRAWQVTVQNRKAARFGAPANLPLYEG